ncbi:hypothetical protein G6R40_12145 [Chryseobacterium sp. POL2]|uniref:hypothetical protein n=1 Tax=Chryseobacterium sp. POL2 TaxID=2713414 RepID=UPI0013E1605A|nr:hypothetical protein [Chryseobacterium sp. POL2]QIG90361.1 hypothetical protein G6R40_12145 [Chryseobacterium sp. POL2]
MASIVVSAIVGGLFGVLHRLDLERCLLRCCQQCCLDVDFAYWPASLLAGGRLVRFDLVRMRC